MLVCLLTIVCVCARAERAAGGERTARSGLTPDFQPVPVVSKLNCLQGWTLQVDRPVDFLAIATRLLCPKHGRGAGRGASVYGGRSMQKAARCSPSTISGKELPGLVVSGLAAPLCAALPCRNQEKERKERKGSRKKEERNEGAGMPGPVEHRHSRKSPQRCWDGSRPCPGAGHRCDQLSRPAGSSQ